MGRRYGYCRISTGRQNIERQERNIKAAFPDAIVVREVYTGTRFQGRKELERLLGKVQPGDTIIFDSVSRMSRDAEEGFRLYEGLFQRGVSLVFLKEPHIDTETYRKAMASQVGLTGEKVDLILEGVNRYLMELAGCFHRFYTACRIKGEAPEVQAARLKLADNARIVLRNGLKLIGVEAPEKM